MKGLLLDSFYKTVNGMKILLFLLIIIGAVIIAFSDDAFIVQAYIIAVFLSISVYALISIRKDAESKWSRYEIILPVRRNTIILSKFISFLLWVLVSVFMAVLFIGAAVIMKGNLYFDFGLRDIVTIVVISVSLALQIGSVFYMGLYLFGLDKTDILMILSVIVSVGLIGLLVGIINRNRVSIETGRFIVFFTALLFFGVSYNITKYLYKKSEF